jgi:peptidoglycan/xylan/chitin deacetylase (PgdA/CDA1 family)
MSSDRSFLSRILGSIFYFISRLRGGSKGTRILCYHRVNDREKGYLSVPVDAFRKQMKWLSEQGYHSASLADLLDGKIDEKSVVITFDDGYEDNYQHAFPIMRDYGFQGIIFLIAKKIGEPSYLKISQIEDMMKSGFEFGSHTLSHPNLKTLSVEQKRHEIADSKIALEKLFGTPFDFFCYPFGQFDAEAAQIVKETGYRGACCNAPGANAAIANPCLLKRTEVAPHDSPEDLEKKMAGAYDLLHILLHKLRGRP